MNYKMSNRGLLSLGIIVSLSVTLTGFEYMSSETKITSKRLAKADPLDTEVIFDPVIQKPEVPKPDVPQEKPRINPVVAPPVTPVGPIVVSPVAPVDPGVIIGDPIDPIGPIDPGIGTQKPVFDSPVDPYSLEEFPTYEEFKKIKNKDDRFNHTTQTIVNKVKGKVKYSDIARELNIQGTVYAEFIVDKSGNITDVKIVKGLHESLDSQVLKAIKALPIMIPGKQRDIPVNVRFTIPVKFELN